MIQWFLKSIPNNLQKWLRTILLFKEACRYDRLINVNLLMFFRPLEKERSQPWKTVRSLGKEFIALNGKQLHSFPYLLFMHV